MSGYLRRHHVGLAALFIALGGTAIAAFDPVGSDGDIDACFNKKTKALTLAKKKCKKGSKPVSWSQAGPAGPRGATGPSGATGQTGATGTTGASGTARAYGLVQPNGLLLNAQNATVNRATVGVFCVSVPGASPSTDVILLTSDYSTAQNGTATFPGNGPADPITNGGGSANLVALWDPTAETCGPGEFEVQTAEQRVDSSANTITLLTLHDEGFSFVVP